jgi:nicotinate-nucleotide--dimethylbenzimidazole phosphoribosyltransferase
MSLEIQLQQIINNKTKPLGALGMLEDIAYKIGLIQQTPTPQLNNPHIIVFAADHGIAANGKVNPFPQAVTAQMVLNFVQEGAAINVFCKQNNITLQVVDAGVNYNFNSNLPIIHASIRKGTYDYTSEHAMSIDQVMLCLQKGGNIVQHIFDKGCNIIGFGEMGIGNTSSASLIMHQYCNLPIEACVGRGTGVNNEQLKQKLLTLQETCTYHSLGQYDITPHSLLARIGGFEIAMMAGAYIKAYELGMTIMVDGFIATAALLSAIKIMDIPKAATHTMLSNAAILQHCIFCHSSGEQGHQKILDQLQVTPILNLGMRLGEGTGAALAYPIIQNAIAFLNNMASFDSAGVSNT